MLEEKSGELALGNGNENADLQNKIKSQENELKKMRDEFNSQRAKMKELFMAKEGDCKKLAKEYADIKRELDETKSQLMIAEYSKEKDLDDQTRRAQEEIQTLQQLVHETVEVNTMSAVEIKRLSEENEKLRIDNHDLIAQQDSPSLAPVLNQAKKIIRKLGAADSSSHDNLEDSMRKVNKYAQEDAEVLRSLVVPLEEEIKTLKEKLRNAYEEMEKHRGDDKRPPESALVGMLKESKAENSSHKEERCEMCENYETKLVQSQETINDERQKNLLNEKSVERLREELNKEAALRRDLEAQWQEKREEHKNEVQKLTDITTKSNLELQKLNKIYSQLKSGVNEELQKLSEEREQVFNHLDVLQKDNDFLSGKYLENSEMLKDQEINLPQNIEELHELVLRLHENLIVSKTGCEYAEAKTLSFQDEVNLLRDQQHSRDKERQYVEQDMSNRIRGYEEKLRQQDHHQQKLISVKDELERKEVENKKQISDLRMQIIELQAANEKLDRANIDIRNKMSVLQEDLANNEAVQKDFVKLSQSLQMQLEKIRSADTQVRWQDEDDVDQCSNCKKEFTVTRRKQHCRHCGTIYCPACLAKTVPSGPNRKPARVCDVCHTLLVQDTAPYFSREPPQSP